MHFGRAAVERVAMTKSWADLLDEEGEVFVTVRLPSGKSTHVVMESTATVQDLNQWIEDSEGIPRQSFVLAWNEERYLKRQRVMSTLGSSCELQLISRTENGRPRGMVLRRCGAPMFGKRPNRENSEIK